MNSRVLHVIEGDKADLENQFKRLLNAPHEFSIEEFDALCKVFSDRLTRAEVYEIAVLRIRKSKFKNQLEHNLLLSIIDGNDAEVVRLNTILRKRNAIGLTVI